MNKVLWIGGYMFNSSGLLFVIFSNTEVNKKVKWKIVAVQSPEQQ